MRAGFPAKAAGVALPRILLAFRNLCMVSVLSPRSKAFVLFAVLGGVLVVL